MKDTDKLSILQANDHFRDWHTLGDERVCVLCDRKFTGHDIQVSTAGSGTELHCPTADCQSGVHQWVYPGNPLLSEESERDWWQALGSTDDLADGGVAPAPQPLRSL